MSRCIPLLLILIVLLNACKQKMSDSQLRAINESLINANNEAEEDNRVIYSALQNKSMDPQTASQAAVWLPKAERLQRNSAKIRKLINWLKNQLIKQSDSLNKTTCELVSQLGEPTGKGFGLLNDLIAFKDSIPAIFKPVQFTFSPYVYKVADKDSLRINNMLTLLKDYSYPMSEKERDIYGKKWLENNFVGSSSIMTMLILNKLENDVLATENRLISYCLQHAGTIYKSCNRQEPIAILSTGYVKSGQAIQVTAGMGSFIDYVKPIIKIGDKEIKLNSDGVAEYSFIANGKPGKHAIRATFQYTKQDGSSVVVWKDLKYIISE